MAVVINGDNTPTAGGVVYGDGTDYVSTSAGTSGQVLISAGSGAPTWGSAGYTLGTPQSMSGSASYAFSVPTSAKQIIMTFNAMSMTHADPLVTIQIGTGSVYATSGYESTENDIYQASGTFDMNTSSSGFLILKTTATGNNAYGTAVLTLENASSNTWVCSSTLSDYSTRTQHIGNGGVSLSGAINVIKVMVTGTGTFDNGDVNVMYI